MIKIKIALFFPFILLSMTAYILGRTKQSQIQKKRSSEEMQALTNIWSEDYISQLLVAIIGHWFRVWACFFCFFLKKLLKIISFTYGSVWNSIWRQPICKFKHQCQETKVVLEHSYRRDSNSAEASKGANNVMPSVYLWSSENQTYSLWVKSVD